ncbi:MAG TPA: prepilin-type N-terminal cleavage/methylation domain-containing protein [Opitutaceae bacterium]|nr:prepilin-type N-terminal cleavage/methylation domain-containing protein [Opitutaceae bacterium]
MAKVESREDLPPGSTVPTASLRPAAFVVRPGSRGFTLLEVLLVLALIGLITALLAASITRVFSDEHAAPEDIFWQACRSAQKMASLGERETSLSFDTKEKKLVWSNGADTEEARFDPASGEVSVQFLQAQQGGSLMLIAGQVIETQEVPRVRFYPDGTCTAFRVQFRVGANAWQVPIDPWTCAPILEGKK